MSDKKPHPVVGQALDVTHRWLVTARVRKLIETGYYRIREDGHIVVTEKGLSVLSAMADEPIACPGPVTRAGIEAELINTKLYGDKT